MRMMARNKVIEGDYKGKPVLGGARTRVRLMTEGSRLDWWLNRRVIVRYLGYGVVIKWEHTDDWKKGWKNWLWVICNAISRNPNGGNVYWLWIEFWDGKRSLIEVGETIYRKFLYQMEHEYGTD